MFKILKTVATGLKPNLFQTNHTLFLQKPLTFQVRNKRSIVYARSRKLKLTPNKLKSKRAIAKRFKITGSGKLLCRKPNRSHHAWSKTSAQRRRLTGWAQITGKQRKNILKIMNGKR